MRARVTNDRGLCYMSQRGPQPNGSRKGASDAMARGRLKDKKTRKKHRKNIKRMKALAKARREQAHAAKSKRK